MGFSGGGSGAIPASVVSDSSADPASPIVASSSPRNRALRDFLSVLDFGTYISGDMTNTLQAALDAASTKGTANNAPCRLYLPENVYLTKSLIPKPWVEVWGYGAQMARNSADLTNHSIFYQSVSGGVGAPITRFSLRGITVLGTGSENTFQGFLLLDRSTFIRVEDCFINGNAGNPVYLANCQYCWVTDNQIVNCTQASGPNPINFVNGPGGNIVPLKYLWCKGNLVTGSPTFGIAIAVSGTADRTDPVIDAHITDNTCEVTGGGWPIAIEQGGGGVPPNIKRIDISGNTCIQAGTGNYGIVATNDGPVSNDPLCMSEITIRGNRIVSTGRGILCEASRSAITGNEINAITDDITLAGPGSPSSTAQIGHLVVSGNVGHLGSGAEIKILDGVDTTTLSSSNSQ